MLNDAWKIACEQVDLPFLWVHDLKHTFGRRLRASGASFEDRQDLLGHKSKRITTHYSAAELTTLYDVANRVCQRKQASMPITILRQRDDKNHRRVRKPVKRSWNAIEGNSESRKTPARAKIEISKVA